MARVLASNDALVPQSTIGFNWFKAPPRPESPRRASRVRVPDAPARDLITGNLRRPASAYPTRKKTPTVPPRRITPTATKSTFFFTSASAKNLRINTRKTGHMPGFTGYTPGTQLIAARAYGRTTRRAMKHPSSRDLYSRDLIPASPQLKDKMRPNRPKSYSTGTLPGYTGFVPTSRFQVGIRKAEASVRAGHTGEGLSRSSSSRRKLNISSTLATSQRRKGGPRRFL